MAASDRPTPSAYTAALRALALRDRSTAELRQILTRKAYPPEAVDDAIARLSAQGALDDTRAAAAMAGRLRRRGRATMRIRAELLARGYARDVVARVSSAPEYTEHDVEALERAVDRLLPTLTTPARVEQAMRRLHRRGFGIRAIRAALAERGTPRARMDDPSSD